MYCYACVLTSNHNFVKDIEIKTYNETARQYYHNAFMSETENSFQTLNFLKDNPFQIRVADDSFEILSAAFTTTGSSSACT